MSIGHGAVYAGIAGLLVTSFPTELRFSAVSTTYQLGSTVSSFAPLTAAALATTAHGFTIIAGLAVLVAVGAATATAVLTPPPQPADVTDDERPGSPTSPAARRSTPADRWPTPAARRLGSR